ncbi:hypothetical protein NLN82_26835 [Citrobacter portucalensis]|uniref:ParE family toxin-like protein n=1 Tax=Citrobacter portucalensis TaxID=1639133 RepID=UPI00226B8E9D|nr:hypothetical protein [Citrobacter portucalensis]MCX9039619.1 hypothetical protein [Citrobacter portucalensis]
MKVIAPEYINKKIRDKAFALLCDFYENKKTFTVLKKNGGRWLSIKVNLRFRLLTKNGGTKWELMTTEHFHREVES